ncbi:uncharacterized protein LOC114576310 isoform X2 [Exaiptasia diaphana]|uniref:Uncharacterized protein n=1 Tax=Exaiptasia diaphana TaxID=2652724 RepID=A0A913YWR2_EXADI|nr:uncharacterized protein LOC114576310 isoform X2 [Exaiptasia diaphana]
MAPTREINFNEQQLHQMTYKYYFCKQEITLGYKGFVTDGEFNSLRTAGSERPISIVQLIMDSRNEAKKINSNTIAKYLRPILRQGNIGPEQVHPAVPIADVQWLQDFMTTNNVTFEAAYCPFLHGFVSLYFF